MNNRVLGVGALLAGVLVWVASAELPWPARLLAAALLGPAPVLFVMQARAASNLQHPVPRLRIYAGSIIALWLLGTVSVTAGIASDFTPLTMGLAAVPPLTFLIWTVAGVLGGAAIVLLFKLLGVTESDIMKDITPVTTQEKSVFLFLSLTAGVCEEITFRGVLLPSLATATGSMVGGVALSSMAFGVLHAHQQVAGALRATVLGALLAVPLLATGSIYPSMAAHALIDVIGGLWLARWLFK